MCNTVITHIARRCLSASAAAPVLFNQEGHVATILLNRPKALNSYNSEMVELLLARLIEIERDDSVKVVLVEGAGERAFCAGGDIVHLGNLTRENQLHHKFKTFSKPILSIADRIVMGGGMGLCCNSRYRVGTERSMFAMPETRIGFFPDAGATFFLSRLGDVGMFLAMTGHRVRGFDARHLGFATHFVESGNLGGLKADIIKCTSEKDLLDCLISHDLKEEQPELSFKHNLLEISKTFSASSALEVVRRLEESGSQFAQETLKTFSIMSPTGLCLAHRTQTLSKSLNFTECLRMEANIADKTFALGEFAEGVRALLVDKDNTPKWNPPTLEEVKEETLDGVFENYKSDDWQPCLKIQVLEMC